MNEKISKEKLTEVLDGLHLQIVWVWLCLDSLDAIRSLGNERMKIAKNFFYITHSSLIYRYSMELAKLFDEKEGLSIYRIKNMCAQNNEYFDNSFDVNEYCKAFKKALNQHSLLINNLRERRCKTYAHNDEKYYLFSKKATIDFPLDFEEIKSLAKIIYTFAKKMQEKIGSQRASLDYPAHPDDVKRLFGEKTETDLWLENVDF